MQPPQKAHGQPILWVEAPSAHRNGSSRTGSFDAAAAKEAHSTPIRPLTPERFSGPNRPRTHTASFCPSGVAAAAGWGIRAIE